MKLLRTSLLLLCLLHVSCGRHQELQRELAAAEGGLLADQNSIKDLDGKIAGAGGLEKLAGLQLQARELRARIESIESSNQTLLRKWSAIESELSVLKPAAEAFKQQHATVLGTQP